MGFRVGDITLRMENHHNELDCWNFVWEGVMTVDTATLHACRTPSTFPLLTLMVLLYIRVMQEFFANSKKAYKA